MSEFNCFLREEENKQHNKIRVRKNILLNFRLSQDVCQYKIFYLEFNKFLLYITVNRISALHIE